MVRAREHTVTSTFPLCHSLCCSSVGRTLQEPIETERDTGTRDTMPLFIVAPINRTENERKCLLLIQLSPSRSCRWQKMLSLHFNFVSIKQATSARQTNEEAPFALFIRRIIEFKKQTAMASALPWAESLRSSKKEKYGERATYG